jgi:hypothetical protein
LPEDGIELAVVDLDGRSGARRRGRLRQRRSRCSAGRGRCVARARLPCRRIDGVVALGREPHSARSDQAEQDHCRGHERPSQFALRRQLWRPGRRGRRWWRSGWRRNEWWWGNGWRGRDRCGRDWCGGRHWRRRRRFGLRHGYRSGCFRSASDREPTLVAEPVSGFDDVSICTRQAHLDRGRTTLLTEAVRFGHRVAVRTCVHGATLGSFMSPALALPPRSIAQDVSRFCSGVGWPA